MTENERLTNSNKEIPPLEHNEGFWLKTYFKLKEYETIGTVEECRNAVERMKQVEPIRNDKCTCPKCGTHNEVIQKRRNTVAFDTVYCWHCGQAISVVRD